MDSDHVLVLFLGLALVGAAVSIAFASPTLLGGQSDGITDASLASFETTEPYCDDPNTSSGSTLTRDVTGGEALVINETIPVTSNETQVTAEFDKIGTRRYILVITKETPTATPTATPTPTPTPTATPTPVNQSLANGTATSQGPATDTNGTATRDSNGTATAASNGTATEATEQGAGTNRTTSTPVTTETATGCYLKVGYNASIVLANPDDYTVLVTYDGELVGAHWREGDDGGSFDRIPERPDAGTANETATNSSSLGQPEP